MIGGLLTTAKFGWAAVSGVDAFADALAQYSVRMILKSRDIDRHAAERIVSLAQAAVPRDTGLLFSGITATLEDDVWTVQASAVHGRGRWGDANYAFLVEKGTQAGIWRRPRPRQDQDRVLRRDLPPGRRRLIHPHRRSSR